MSEPTVRPEPTGLLADADVQGHFEVVLAVCRSPAWREFWTEFRAPVFGFRDLGLPRDAPDADVWDACQRRGLVLVTGNRNAEGGTSLEATLRARGTATSLPVLTFADPDRILSDRDYAERVAARLMEFLADIENLGGSGRLWLP